MIYEYRCYEAVPGRLPDLHRRFQETTLRMFDKHGIRAVGFWTAEVGTSNELHYLLRWESMAEREQRWGAFQADAEWQQARAASEADGPIVARVRNAFWAPTPYSEMR
jgi:NIPSNAP protein